MGNDIAITKLPKWAQSEINLLRMRLRESEEKIEVLTDAKESPVQYRDLFAFHNLPKRATVRFHTGMQNWIDVCFESDSMVVVRGNTQIKINPEAANSVRVSVVER